MSKKSRENGHGLNKCSKVEVKSRPLSSGNYNRLKTRRLLGFAPFRLQRDISSIDLARAAVESGRGAR